MEALIGAGAEMIACAYEAHATLAEFRQQFPNALISLEGRKRGQVYIT
jgi:hypothetical protein